MRAALIGLRRAGLGLAGDPAFSRALPAPTRLAHARASVRAYAAKKGGADLAKESILGDELPVGDHWSKVARWVVFSDLHVSKQTVSTCVDTLRFVLAQARQRDAGVLFLGDFWHVRGAIPVQPLNTVLEEFREWDRPTIMIPGNHDQVTAGGYVHALTPIHEASDHVHVFNKPTVFLGALWLPYRRNQAELVDAVEAAGDVRAIFAHLDIIGAHVNETFQAREGMPTEAFPADVPTYTGHYHRPQIVPGTKIQYVGSPYQVSFSEAGQQKHLLVLDAAFQEVERIPIKVGPRRYLLDSTEPALELPTDLRGGDMVRWKVPQESIDQAPRGKKKSAVEVAANELRSLLEVRGVSLEVLQPPPKAPPRIEDAESLDTVGMFEAYAEAASLPPEARRVGLDVLAGLDVAGRSAAPRASDVVMEKVTLEGYGPFLHETEYPLAARSVRVVTGRNLDDTGSDSNGAGKTTLVMSPQWCLTGCTDPRIGEGGNTRTLPASDVVNDAATEARVRVDGTVNGQVFVVERCVNKRGTKYLRFSVDGEDLTCQETKMTQEAIDSVLQPAMLMRAAFFGQHAASAMLDAGDREFKEELARVIDLDVWAQAKDATREMLTERGATAAKLEAQVAIRQQQLERLKSQEADTEGKIAAWERDNAMVSQRAARELETLERALAAVLARCSRQASQLEAGAALAREREKEALSALASQPPVARPSTFEVPPEVAELRGRAEAAQGEVHASQLRAAGLQAELRSNRTRFEEHSRLEEGICDRCLQPIDSEAHQQSLAGLRAAMEASEEVYRNEAGVLSSAQAEVAGLTRELRAAEGAWRERTSRAAREADEEARRRHEEEKRAMRLGQAAGQADGVLHRCKQVMEYVLSELPGAGEGAPLPGAGAGAGAEAAEWPKSMSDRELEGMLVDASGRARDFTGDIEERLRLVDRRRNEAGQSETRENPFQREVLRLASQREAVAEEIEADTTGMERALEAAGHLKLVDQAFGRSGIQSFVVEGALGELQRRVGTYLHELSGGALGLTLSASREKKGKAGGTVEKIEKLVHVRSADGRQLPRTLWQLSGGERRRVALALALAYSDFAMERKHLRCNIIVLDEVLQHLDAEGCSRLVRVLKDLPHSTVLLVSQESSFVTNHFSAVDYVCKENGSSTIQTT